MGDWAISTVIEKKTATAMHAHQISFFISSIALYRWVAPKEIFSCL